MSEPTGRRARGGDAVPAAAGGTGGAASERRRLDRRTVARVADLSLPELRRILVTTLLFTLVVALFIWMVRGVVIAAILGIVIAAYLRPIYLRVLAAVHSPSGAAIVTLALVLLPVAATLVYSYTELVRVAQYLSTNQAEVAARIDGALRRIVFLQNVHTEGMAQQWVLMASDYGAAIPGFIRRSLARLSVSTTIFLFTAAYIFTDADRVVAYVRGKVPPRYDELASVLERNVRGVLYGAVYATFVTQALKAGVIFILNESFRVPLAGALAVLSFIIGFFPIVGSWTVYVPVALWLMLFRDAPVQGVTMLLVGMLLNTVFISMYLRPKLAADRSRVLNFYWMFVGLVTGVYTFGLAGILLGPILIGLLKAVVDTVTATASWRSLDQEAVDTGEIETASALGGARP